MHLSRFHARNFRRFSDLTIEDIPETARFVVLAGPNGTGKSSLFDAFMSWEDGKGSIRTFFDKAYHLRVDDPEAKNWLFWKKNLDASFHEPLGERPTKTSWIFYSRTAHRYAGRFEVHSIDRTSTRSGYNGPQSMLDQQSSVEGNFQKIMSRAFSKAFSESSREMKISDWRSEVLGTLQQSVKAMFPELELIDEQDPLETGTFLFRRNGGTAFPYMNLSGGERSAFDLVLDLVAHSAELEDKIILIDEPEVHTNPRIHGELFRQIDRIVPRNSQIWLSTHAVGILRAARDRNREQKASVAFLDFEKDFDLPTILRPTVADRGFWQRSFDVAFSEMASLIAPEKIVLCEGKRPQNGNAVGFDAQVLNLIFSGGRPEVRFISIGSSNDVRTADRSTAAGLIQVALGSELVRLIDRDDHSDEDIIALRNQGIRVLPRRQIESYLFDAEILNAYANSIGRASEAPEILALLNAAISASIGRQNPPDDMKSAIDEFYAALKRDFSITQAGGNASSFARDKLSPLLIPTTSTYQELDEAIFG